MFYLTTHSTHFIYGYMASDIWLRTILIVRKETRCRHIGYSYRLTARVLLYAPSHRQDSTYHGLCYTSRGALAGTRNSSMGHSVRGSEFVIILFYFYFSICFFHCLILHSISVYFSFFHKNNVTGHLHTASTSLTTTYLSFLCDLLKFNLSCLINTNLSLWLS